MELTTQDYRNLREYDLDEMKAFLKDDGATVAYEIQGEGEAAAAARPEIISGERIIPVVMILALAELVLLGIKRYRKKRGGQSDEDTTCFD